MRANDNRIGLPPMLQLPPAIAMSYRPATDHEVRSRSFGIVCAARRLDASGWPDLHGTLYDQAIFGPVRDYECACGKFRGAQHQGMICDRCGVKVTNVAARRQRFGHIELPTPILHPFSEQNETIRAIPVLPAAFVESAGGKALARLYDELACATDTESAPDATASLSCAPFGVQELYKLAISQRFLQFVLRGPHYKRRSGLSRSGIWARKASRMRFCSTLGRATRRNTKIWPVVVSNWMSPIWILLNSRRMTSGVMGPRLGASSGCPGSGFRHKVANLLALPNGRAFSTRHRPRRRQRYGPEFVHCVMPDGPQEQLALEDAEGSLHDRKLGIGLPEFLRRPAGSVAAQQISPVTDQGRAELDDVPGITQ